MIQIFVFGASGAYGVGGAQGGWGDLLKQKLHARMYAEEGAGERYELFNFAYSGATTKFVRDTFAWQFDHYKRRGKAIAVVSVGVNNSKASETPDGFVSTPEAYAAELKELLAGLRERADAVVFVGSGWFDESKTMPKISPFSGKKTYFSNARKARFEAVAEEVCRGLGIPFVGAGTSIEEWQGRYLFQDGLHPNQAGHAFIADRAWAVLEPLLADD